MASLAVGDLNDYLGPSQICIKPTSQPDQSLPPPEPGAASVRDARLFWLLLRLAQIQIDVANGSYFESSTAGTKKLEKAQITLNDCLACSGCITSAESILVSMQSHQEVYKVLDEQPDLIPIVSFSPQSIASLAAAHSIPSRTCLARLTAFFVGRLHFRAVFDTSFARSIALAQTQQEHAERRSTQSLPILASACPGWVCYAEKGQHDLLPLISAVKSPQAIMGILVKNWYAPRYLAVTDRARIYHVSVMPCYDKKLEASRPDFQDVADVRDVDCVLTTGEVLKMLQDAALDLSRAEDFPVATAAPDNVFPPFLTHPGSSSGSYLHAVLAGMLDSLSAPQLHRAQLDIRPVRGADYVDYTLYIPTSKDAPSATLFKGATCYGFRNLQNVVRKVNKDQGLSTGRTNLATVRRAVVRRRKGGIAASASGTTIDAPSERGYDYLEVMACPSGCVNGGGQLLPPGRTLDAEGLPLVLEGPLPGQAWVTAVEKTYWSHFTDPTCGEGKIAEVHPSIRPLLGFNREAEALGRRVVADLGEAAFRTQYRPVVSEEINGLAVKW